MTTEDSDKDCLSEQEIAAEVQPWDLPYWANPPPEPVVVEDEVPSVPLPTAEEVEAIIQSAHQDGYTQGLLEGREQGHQQGHQQGLQQGLAEGKKQGLEQGLAEGRPLGFEEGKTQGKDKVAEAVTAFETLAQRLIDPLAEQQTALESVLARLIEQALVAILRIPPEYTDQQLLQLIQETLKALPVGTEHIQVFLSTRDCELLTTLGQELATVGLHADEQLESGSLRIETDTSLIDYRLEERLRQVLEELRLEHYPEQRAYSGEPVADDNGGLDPDESTDSVAGAGASGADVDDTGASGADVDDIGASDSGVDDTGVDDTGASDSGVDDIGASDSGVDDIGASGADVDDMGASGADVSDIDVDDIGASDSGVDDTGASGADVDDMGASGAGGDAVIKSNDDENPPNKGPDESPDSGENPE